MKYKTHDLNAILYLSLDWFVIVSTFILAAQIQNHLYHVLFGLLLASRIHALGVFLHEAVHGNLVPHNSKLNTLLGNIFCGSMVFLSVDHYRSGHLPHHQYLFTDSDPDWKRKTKNNFLKLWIFPMERKKLFLNFLLSPFFFIADLFRQSRMNSIRDVGLYFISINVILISLVKISNGEIYNAFFSYGVAYFIFLPLMTRLRQVVEHFGNIDDDIRARDIILIKPLQYLFFPHCISLHKTHHLNSHIPFYELKKKSLEINSEKIYDSFFWGKKPIFTELRPRINVC